MDKRNTGLHQYRFASNPHELAAAEWWDDNNRGCRTLGYLLGDGSREAILSERDEVVAATLMQWLGSPVGRSLLGDLMQRFEAVDEKLRGKRRDHRL